MTIKQKRKFVIPVKQCMKGNQGFFHSLVVLDDILKCPAKAFAISHSILVHRIFLRRTLLYLLYFIVFEL